MVATASMFAIDCWQMAQISSGEDCHSWNMECWESHWIWRLSKESSWVPVRRSWRTCAWEGRGPRQVGTGGGMERADSIGALTGRPAGQTMKLFGCLPGSTSACQVLSRRSWGDAGGRMAIVVHDDPLAGEGAMKPWGAGLSTRVE